MYYVWPFSWLLSCTTGTNSTECDHLTNFMSLNGKLDGQFLQERDVAGAMTATMILGDLIEQRNYYGKVKLPSVSGLFIVNCAVSRT